MLNEGTAPSTKQILVKEILIQGNPDQGLLKHNRMLNEGTAPSPK
jgi:hypothetical protein